MPCERWNSNLHALEVLLARLPADAVRGLDVGCGEGETARRLRRRLPEVTGLDVDRPSVEAARSYGDDIRYVVGDLLTADVEEASFDVVTAVAVLHHVDHRAALGRLGGWLRPGGRLLVVGLARSRTVADHARDAVDAVALRRHSLRKGVWHTPSPQVWPPPLTHAQTCAASIETLPGARFERLPYFRYGLTWTRPPGWTGPGA